MKDGITIAVSKGRILAEFLPLLARADIRPWMIPTRPANSFLRPTTPAYG